MKEIEFNWVRTMFRRVHGLESGTDGPLPDASRLAFARRHRIAGLRVGTPPCSGSTDAWSRYVYAQAVHSAQLSAEAGRIYAALRDSVKRLRLVKGPALALQAWPDTAVRSFDDLDFRCDRQSLDALLAGMGDLGYEAEQNSVRLRHLWHYGWGISFRHEDGYHVECNHRMFPPHYPWPIHLNGMHERWEMLNLDGTDVLCPGPALHLLYSCVHAVWHGWERMAWAVDIAGLLVRYPGCFDDACALVPGNRFARRALYCGCGTADRMAGPLQGGRFSGEEVDGSIVHSMEMLMRQDAGGSPENRRRLHCELMNVREAFFYTARRMATPGDPDFRFVPLPQAGRSLYWLLRPLRVAAVKAGDCLCRNKG